MLLRALVLIAAALSLSGCFAVATTAATSTAVAAAQERSIGTAVDDNIIYAEIKGRYLKKDIDNLLVGVGVEVIEGVVHLTGKVKQPETAIDAVNIAWQVNGVREVVNEIQVTDTSGISNFAQDSWIEAQIASRMLFGKHIRSVNYSVEVVNSTVYLMGIALSQDELDRVINIARTTKYVKEVVSHVRLIDDPRRSQPVP